MNPPLRAIYKRLLRNANKFPETFSYEHLTRAAKARSEDNKDPLAPDRWDVPGLMRQAFALTVQNDPSEAFITLKNSNEMVYNLGLDGTEEMPDCQPVVPLDFPVIPGAPVAYEFRHIRNREIVKEIWMDGPDQDEPGPRQFVMITREDEPEPEVETQPPAEKPASAKASDSSKSKEVATTKPIVTRKPATTDPNPKIPPEGCLGSIVYITSAKFHAHLVKINGVGGPRVWVSPNEMLIRLQTGEEVIRHAVEYLRDEPMNDEETEEAENVREQIIDVCNQLFSVAPTLEEILLKRFGYPPNDLERFSFWALGMASLPIEKKWIVYATKSTRLKLLKNTDTVTRLVAARVVIQAMLDVGVDAAIFKFFDY